MSLVRTVTVVFLNRIATLAVAAIGLVYFTRELGPNLFGSFVLFRTLIVILGIFVDLGINGAIEKRISERKSGEIVGAAFLLKLIPCVVLFGGIYLFSSTVNQYIGLDLAFPLILVLIVEQLGRQYAATLRGEQRVDLAEVGQTMQGMIFTIGGIILIYLDWQVLGLVTALFTSWAVLSVWLFIRCETTIAVPTRDDVLSVMTFAKYNFVSSVIGHRSYNWIDTFVIGLFLSPTFVAGYEIAWQVTKLTTLLSKAIGKTLFPQVSEWDADQNRGRIQAVLPDALLAAVLFVIPAILGIALLGEEIIGLVFGAEYTFAVGAAVVLMVSKIFDGVNDIVSRVLLGLNRPDVIARAVVVFVTANLGFNLILVYYFGITGAAIATALSIVTLVGMLTYNLNKEVAVSVNLRRLGTVVLASLGMAIVVWLVSQFVLIESIQVLGGMIALGVATYLALLGASGDFRTQFKTLIADI